MSSIKSRFKGTATILAAASLALGLGLTGAPEASAHGTCWSGVSYGGAGTPHNYVEFQVNANAVDWHVHREWWALFKIELWDNPDGHTGIARAGIADKFDQDPLYPPSAYKICTGSGPRIA